MGYYQPSPATPIITVSNGDLCIEEVGQIARKEALLELSTSQKFTDLINAGPATVAKLVKEGHVIYGVTTGLGESCTVPISPDMMAELPSHVIQFHGCGAGAYFPPEETRSILTARLVSLAKGFSAVRLELIQQIVLLLQHDILPRIPQEGSVGASGDLTPLSYIGAVLCGHRDVWYEGKVVSAKDALAQAGIPPLTLIPKEALALINGTSAMTGVACMAYLRARKLAQFATRLTSLSIFALKGNRFHYDEVLFKAKPHPGQIRVASRLRSDLGVGHSDGLEQSKAKRIQDRYSLRCSPHVIGVFEDVLDFVKTVIERELNSANDNPLISTENGGRVLHSAMFYGGHMAMAMDTLKTQVASIADLLDRQMALLVDPLYNNGLPANLTGSEGPRAAINHGLKGLQISVSAFTAEALKLTMPASSFSRSTECHNQDKVSMGTIAARDCVRTIELAEQVVAGLMIALRQALEIREDREGLEFKEMSDQAKAFWDEMKGTSEFVREDVFLEPILRKYIKKIRENNWPLYVD